MQTEQLTGNLEYGDRLVWEPFKPHARAEVTVVPISEYVWPYDGRRCVENMVALKDANGRVYLNDESRVREACIRACSFASPCADCQSLENGGGDR